MKDNSCFVIAINDTKTLSKGKIYSAIKQEIKGKERELYFVYETIYKVDNVFYDESTVKPIKQLYFNF